MKRSSILLLAIAMVCGPRAFAVPLYGVFEKTFVSKSYTNPYTATSGTVTFTQPDGSGTVSIPLFYDGVNGSNVPQWKVRFSPWMKGTWSYTVSSMDDTLNATTNDGSFTCETAGDKGSITANPTNPYHFAYQDGTPFFWYADTQWRLLSNDAAESLNRTSVAAYIEDRAERRFNVVHAMLSTQGNEGGAPYANVSTEVINPAYWAEVDARIQQLGAQGIIAGLVLSWADDSGGTFAGLWSSLPNQAARERYTRYIAARYSAYKVYFLVAGEWQLWPAAQGTEAQARDMFKSLGAVLRAADPHGRMIGVHAATSGTISPYQSEVFADEPWASFADYQQYYGTAPDSGEGSDTDRNDLRARVKSSRDHDKPVVNAEYAYYLRNHLASTGVTKQNSHTQLEFRRASWLVLMGGGYFVTGFGNTYRGGLSDTQTFFATDSAYDVAYADLTRLREFFTGIDYWKLDPHDTWLSGSGGYRNGLAAAGDTYVVYTVGATSANLTLNSTASATYSVQRYNPRTGEYTALADYAGTGTIALIPSGTSPPDVTQDWVYLVKNKAGSTTPRARWKLDEGSAERVSDSSGHADVGTIFGGASKWAAGHSAGSRALQLDGTDDYVDVGNPTDLQLTGSMSISAWVWADSWASAPEYSIVSKRGGTADRGWALRKDLNTDRLEIAVSNATNATAVLRSLIPLSAGSWHHVVAVYDASASALHLYIDNADQSGTLSGTVPAVQRNSLQNVNLGRRPSGGGFFPGRLADVQIFNTALSSAQVDQLYRGVAP